MATLTAGQSATIGLDAWATLSLVVSGKATLAFTSGAENVQPSFDVTNATSRDFGPYGCPMSVVVTAVDRSLTYTITGGVGGYKYDSAGNVTGLVGPSGANVDVLSPTVGTIPAYQPARTALPERLPVFENFSRISSFTVTTSGATFTADTDSGVFLPTCVNMTTSIGSGSNAYGTKNITFNQNTVDGMWLYLRTNIRQSAATPGVTLYAGPLTDLGAGNRWTYSLPSTLSLTVGEQAIWIPKTGWTVLDGSPSWASDMLSYRVRIDSHAVDAKDIDLLGIMWGGAKPTVIITFDDGWDTSYSVGWVEAQKRGIPLTHYIIASEVDTSGNVTTAQIQEMAASGDYIGLHGLNPWGVTSRIATDKAAVLATGLSDCKHAAYPEGDIGATTAWRDTKAAMQAAGIVTARLAANVQTPALLGYTDPLLLPAYPLNNTMSLANARAAVDQAILSGGTVIFYGHKLAGASDSLTWVTSDYTALLDYINQRRITRQLEVTTIDRWAAQLYLNAR